MTGLQRLFWFSLIIKLLIAAVLPLTADEAYYWVWSQHMQLSFYDHPPFVAWLYWLGSWMNWFPGSVRWPGVLLAHLSLALWLKVFSTFLDARQLKVWLWLALLSPLVGGSGIIVTPDVPLMFFYALSVLLFLAWQKQPNAYRAVALGVSMGLGFSSKYMMVLFALSLLPVVLLSSRREFFRSLPWFILGGAVGALPVWLWNLMNDFESFRFQTEHGLGGRRWKPSWTTDYILTQVALIFPPIVYWANRQSSHVERHWRWLAWTPLVFFLITTSRGYVEANWPLVAYPILFALAASGYPKARLALLSTAAVWAVALTALATIVVLQPNWARGTKLKEFHEFDAAIQVAHQVEPLFARSYQMASKMTYELGRPIYKLKGINRRDFYDFLEGSKPKTRIYYVIGEKSDVLPAEWTTQGHRIVEKTPVDELYDLWKVEAEAAQ